MTHQIWQRYMLEAENALGAGALGTAICLYQQALGEVYELASGDLDELASMRVATCHRMADFWRAMEEPAYELRYLKLASELVTALGGGLQAGQDAPTEERQAAPKTPATLAIFDKKPDNAE